MWFGMNALCLNCVWFGVAFSHLACDAWLVPCNSLASHTIVGSIDPLSSLQSCYIMDVCPDWGVDGYDVVHGALSFFLIFLLFIFLPLFGLW